jgi:hypothetical protein
MPAHAPFRTPAHALGRDPAHFMLFSVLLSLSLIHKQCGCSTVDADYCCLGYRYPMVGSLNLLKLTVEVAYIHIACGAERDMAMRRIFWAFCRNWFLIDPLHHLSSRSDFDFEFVEIFVIEKRLSDSPSRRVGF